MIGGCKQSRDWEPALAKPNNSKSRRRSGDRSLRTAVGSRHTTFVPPAITVHQPSIPVSAGACRRNTPVIDRRAFITMVGGSVLAVPFRSGAEPARLYRVGIVLQGGDYLAAVDGLRDGFRELGFEEGQQLVLHVRDVKGDLKSVEAVAQGLEREKVDLIYSLATSVTLTVKQATTRVPIVFYAGTDPVTVGLVESFRKPGGRLTGIHGQLTDLTAKRLELLKDMLPRLRRVVTFYSPDNPAAQQSVKIARAAARQLKIEL